MTIYTILYYNATKSDAEKTRTTIISALIETACHFTMVAVCIAVKNVNKIQKGK